MKILLIVFNNFNNSQLVELSAPDLDNEDPVYSAEPDLLVL